MSRSHKFNFDQSTALNINGLWISFVEINYALPLASVTHNEIVMRCSFVLNEEIKVASVRVVKCDANGFRVRMPQRVNNNPDLPKRFVDTTYPVTPRMRLMVNTVLMTCYERALAESGAVAVAASTEGGEG